MGMSRCYSLMKCLLIIFSIIFLCVGSGACGFAAWALWEGRGNESAAERAGLCALATWAGTLTLGALAALCGAIRGSGRVLAGALGVLALAAAGGGAAAWWGAAHGPQLRAALTHALAHALRHEYGRDAPRTQLLDLVQHQLACCGVDGVRDWQESYYSRRQEAAEAPAAPSEPAAEARALGALNLSVSAPAVYYWVPESCCAAPGPSCERARRLPRGAGAGAGAGPGQRQPLWGAGCGPLVVGALQAMARAPLACAGALLAALLASLPLALALALAARPRAPSKA